MIREICAPKLLDWFIAHVVKQSRHAEELRLRWKDRDTLIGRAGWSLTTDRVVKAPEGLDLDALAFRPEGLVTAKLLSCRRAATEGE